MIVSSLRAPLSAVAPAYTLWVQEHPLYHGMSIAGPCALSPPTAQPCTCTCKAAAPSEQSGIPKSWLGVGVFSSLAFWSKTFQGVRAAFKQLPVAPAEHSEWE